jgi:mannose-6-phosphate isomerase-like protein (cupin superfamily)
MAIQSGEKGEFRNAVSAYDRWVQSQGIPVYEGYYIEDLRTLELGRWESRECYGAFLKLAGQEGICEARVTEIPAGKTLPPLKCSLDELVYVVDGRGLTAVGGVGGKTKTTFEWQKHSLFLIPRNTHHQFSNVQGNRPVRLLHYNYLPVTMSAIPDAKFFFDNPYVGSDILHGQNGGLYSEAKLVRQKVGAGRRESLGWTGRDFWYGNFFPDLRSWDKLEAQTGRGGGSHVVHFRFPNSSMVSHMSVPPGQSYKKAHRHGPAAVIVIPAGEGYSIMWKEGQEKVVIPWHEGSVFVPPNRWWHQHFNVGSSAARYLALRTPQGMSGYSESVEDRRKDQIEYPDEDPWIREKFEAELAKRGLKSLMPAEAYRDRNFEWKYGEG